MRKNQEKRQSKTLLDILREEKTDKYQGGIYHKTQIDLTSVSYTHLTLPTKA